MGIAATDKVQIKFSKPDTLMNTITVYRVLADDSTEPIGKLFPDTSEGEDSPIYISANELGEELFPPSSNFIEIEEQFKKYAAGLSEKSITENMQKEAEVLLAREKAIKQLRKTNERNRGFNLLLNNF